MRTLGTMFVGVQMMTKNRQAKRIDSPFLLSGIPLKRREALVAEGVPKRVAREMRYRVEDVLVMLTEGEA